MLLPKKIAENINFARMKRRDFDRDLIVAGWFFAKPKIWVWKLRVHMKFKLKSTFEVHNVRWGFSRKEGQKNMHYWLCIITIVTFLKSCVISSDVKWSILKFADWFFVYGHWADFIQLSKFWILRIRLRIFFGGNTQLSLYIFKKNYF